LLQIAPNKVANKVANKNGLFIADKPCGPAACCWLSYEPENETAKALYASFGFQETGEWDGDEKIAVLNLEKACTDIRYVEKADHDFWFSLDRHLSEDAFMYKVGQRMGYILRAENEPIALLRYSLFWDSIPFCNLLYVKETMQRQGYGRSLMEHWESDMKARGYNLVMTSTQADEEAQHFYRALGYQDCGSLILPFPGYEQPAELIMAKQL
jgi:ribosomal protein S18 acetylase RimI-like enzyme